MKVEKDIIEKLQTELWKTLENIRSMGSNKESLLKIKWLNSLKSSQNVSRAFLE